VRLIETTIAPKGWVNRGGSGQLHYNPELKTFFIVQTEEVQEAIHELINLKRTEKVLKKGDNEAGEEEHRLLSSFRFDPQDEICIQLEKAHRDLLAGRIEDARARVRSALAMDRQLVLSHPLVYKMQLLHQVLAEPVKLEPHMPGVDPGVVHAYHEILEEPLGKSTEAIRPVEIRRVKPAVLEIEEEACELEIVPTEAGIKPVMCIESCASTGTVSACEFSCSSAAGLSSCSTRAKASRPLVSAGASLVRGTETTGLSFMWLTIRAGSANRQPHRFFSSSWRDWRGQCRSSPDAISISHLL
jgi:hypothetical protein